MPKDSVKDKEKKKKKSDKKIKNAEKKALELVAENTAAKKSASVSKTPAAEAPATESRATESRATEAPTSETPATEPLTAKTPAAEAPAPEAPTPVNLALETSVSEQPHDCCAHKTKDRSDKEVRDLINRLSRIEGQIRGIKRMVESGSYCPDILVQVAAANAALNSFNKALLAEHIRTCVAEDIRQGKDETIDELVVTLQKLMK